MTGHQHFYHSFVQISIHTTRVGGDKFAKRQEKRFNNFNPHHPCGWWHQQFKKYLTRCQFQSTPPVWVVTKKRYSIQSDYDYFNPHHPCGWWRITNARFPYNKDFNPHHPCGWWQKRHNGKSRLIYFNPHHPCGWWLNKYRDVVNSIKFQSTPPVWVVTGYKSRFSSQSRYFNPHHPCGWWRIWCWRRVEQSRFQSTPPVWVVTFLS